MGTTFKFLLFVVCLLWNQESSAVHLPSLGSENHFDEVCYSYDYKDAITDHLISKYLICKHVNVQPAKPSILLDIPPKNVQYIAFQNSSLPMITNEMFANFTNLSILNLKKSNISSVSPQAFRGMTQLEELHLQNNNIQGFLRGTFDFLTNLKLLDLSNNALSTLHQKLLSNLTNLKVLKLADNNLYFLKRDCFFALRSLEVLDLTNNHILLDSFHTVFHIGSKSLMRVMASGNLFLKFPVIGNLTRLTFMDISYNRWTQIDLHQFYHLKFANASYNKITTICTLAVTAIEDFYLEELDLSYNLIKKIDEHVFQNLTHLQRLHLNNNFIKKLAPGCFANLKNMTFLSLSFNELEYLEFGYFTGLEKLMTLQLDHNNLFKQSKDFSFSNLKSLRYLHVDNNLYNAIDAKGIVKALPNLKMITLKNNRWYCKKICEAIETFHNNSIVVAEKRVEESYIVSNACPGYFSDYLHNIALHLLFFKASVLLILMIMISLVILIIRRQYFILRFVNNPRTKTIRKLKPVVIRMSMPKSAIKNVH